MVSIGKIQFPVTISNFDIILPCNILLFTKFDSFSLFQVFLCRERRFKATNHEFK